MFVIKHLAEEIVFNHTSTHTQLFIWDDCRLPGGGSQVAPLCQRRTPPGSEGTTAARLLLHVEDSL